MLIKRLNLRFLFLALVLAAVAAIVVAREHRPSFLSAEQRLYAYVANAGDGTVTVVDLISLSPKATVSVGAAPAGLQVLARRKQVWGVASGTGHVWVIDA